MVVQKDFHHGMQIGFLSYQSISQLLFGERLGSYRKYEELGDGGGVWIREHPS